MTIPFTTPEWVHHAIFYQIFPDRFAFSGQVTKPNNLERWDTPPTPYGFKGGDLVGVVEKLDYLQDLGITALYFTPVFSSASNHRYHTHDYLQIDPLLGGKPAFDLLRKETAQRGIRLVLDGVFNHASRGFFQFNHILEVGGQSPYLDWFKVKGFPLHAYEGKANYECWWNLPALPTLNHANPQVRKYIMDVARYWLDQGIDGWRLDVPFEVKEPGFWEEFRDVVKTANPDAYITGEVPWDSTQYLRGDQFDGVMNYLMTYACWSFFGGEKMSNDLVGHWRAHDEEAFVNNAPAFANYVTGLLSKYPRPAVLAQLNLLDSHDTARLLSITSSKEALRLAALFMFTYPGAPCVYYGDEIGIEGGKDPDCRRAFNWNEKSWDVSLLSYYKALIALRKQYRCLRDGEWKILFAGDGVVAYQRTYDQERAVIVLNNAANTFEGILGGFDSVPDGTIFKNRMGAGEAVVRQASLTGVSVPSYSGAIYIS